MGPYVGYSNETLSRLPPATAGQLVACAGVACALIEAAHPLENTEPPSRLLIYRCGEKLYLGAVGGRLIVGVAPDVSSSTIEERSHLTCARCWRRYEGDRVPYAIVGESPASCCYCGRLTVSGIYRPQRRDNERPAFCKSKKGVRER